MTTSLDKPLTMTCLHTEYKALFSSVKKTDTYHLKHFFSISVILHIQSKQNHELY